MAHAKGKVVVTAEQRSILERLVRAYTTRQHIVQRARIVLMSADGLHNVDQARELGTDPQRVRRWRRRWADAWPMIEAAEGAGDLEEVIVELLNDEQRSGRKPIFTAEQVAQIIAVACERPSEASNRPVTHWTPRELRDEVIKRGIVSTISVRHIARFFGGSRSQAAPVAVLAQLQAEGPRPRGLRARRQSGLRHLSNRS